LRHNKCSIRSFINQLNSVYTDNKMGYLKDDLVYIPTNEGYKSEIEVLDNDSSGFFFVGTIQTPIHFIGKRVTITVNIVED